MKKITVNKMNFATGEMEVIEEKIKVKNFDDGEASIFFKQHLIKLGYKSALDKIVVKKRMEDSLLPTIYGYRLKCKFATWQAIKDSENGKAVLWVGNKNIKGLTDSQLTDAVLVNENRIVKTDCDFFGIVIVPRGFKLGMSIIEADFMDYIIMPLNALIERMKETKQDWIDIRQKDRLDYSVSAMMPEIEGLNDNNS